MLLRDYLYFVEQDSPIVGSKSCLDLDLVASLDGGRERDRLVLPVHSVIVHGS